MCSSLHLGSSDHLPLKKPTDQFHSCPSYQKYLSARSLTMSLIPFLRTTYMGGSGFKQRHSTDCNAVSNESLHSVGAARQSSVVLLLDRSAAFDTVNHQILSTLTELSISGSALHWFMSDLSGRSFRVSWRGEVSKPNSLSTGVPQGSVLGPLLNIHHLTRCNHPFPQFLIPLTCGRYPALCIVAARRPNSLCMDLVMLISQYG